MWDSEVIKILGESEGKVTGVHVKNNKTNQENTLDCAGVFIAIGHVPNTQIFEGQLEMDEDGYLITKPDSTATDIPGIYAAGDVQDHIFRQAVTAAGTGCMSAIDVERYLEHVNN